MTRGRCGATRVSLDARAVVLAVRALHKLSLRVVMNEDTYLEEAYSEECSENTSRLEVEGISSTDWVIYCSKDGMFDVDASLLEEG